MIINKHINVYRRLLAKQKDLSWRNNIKQLGNAKLSSLISLKLRNLLPVYIIKIYLLGNSKRIM